MSDGPVEQNVRPEYEIGVRDALAASSKGTLTILDIREHEELAVVKLDTAEHIPASEFAARVDEIMDLADASGPEGLALMCHVGVRSFQATMLLRQEGVENVRSLAGGIDAWSVYIDPDLPRY
ncbi:MAG: rhodanese-like domain-containing protein [Planctomycetota bacterium]